ncbi:hypothetical protein Mapa_004018 [Marchantia paleacea]|nr:hypothetical protein Mapa_004018 [Marchantia paleacea]
MFRSAGRSSPNSSIVCLLNCALSGEMYLCNPIILSHFSSVSEVSAMESLRSVTVSRFRLERPRTVAKMANIVRISTAMSGKTKVAMTLARMALVERFVKARMITTMTRMVQTMRKTAMTVAKVTTRSEKISKATEASTTPTSKNVNPRVSGRESIADANQAHHSARQQNVCLFKFPIRYAQEKTLFFHKLRTFHHHQQTSIFKRRMFLSLPRQRNGVLLPVSV